MSTRASGKAARVANIVIAIIGVVLLGAVVFGVYYLFTLGKDLFGSASGDVVIVPEVVGLSVADAEVKIRERGMVPDVVRRHYDDDHEAGLITKQNPDAEARRRQGSKVNLWESLGPASFTVPRLTGQQYDQALLAIANSGLLVGSVKKVFDSEIPRGRVINQSPEAGREFHTPVPVDIVVADSSAAEEVQMPALSGMRLVQAEERLALSNLHLFRVTYIATDESPEYTVLSQSIPQGRNIAIGTKVELEVALPVELMQRKTKTITIRVPLLPGATERDVKIKVFDKLSPSGYVEYNDKHTAGDQIEHLVHVEGKATIMIFIDDMQNPYREERL